MIEKEKNELGIKRKQLNEEYDNYILDIIENQNIDYIKNNKEKIIELQNTLFLLEKEILKYV